MEHILFQTMTKDRKVRREICKNSLLHFLSFYYAHYLKYPTADFQKEMISDLQNSSSDLFIVAFRGSAKSTIVTTAYAVWSILGVQQKKFCLILCQTKVQAKQHMKNIRQELENNSLLRNDLGPFEEESDEWGSFSIVFKNHNARISVASTEQSIRGIRHNEHRPDLIICDDIEDIASTRNREMRDKTHQWLFSEVVPAGSNHTRLIIVGNLLHEDSVLMRIKKDILSEKRSGIFREYPLIDEQAVCLWPGRYPNQESLDREKAKVVNESFWQREYLLKIIPDEQQVIHREWIQYYDDLPITNKYTKTEYLYTIIGTDLAISEKDSADFTSFVSIQVYKHGDKKIAYVLPNIVNKRLNFVQQIEILTSLYKQYPSNYKNSVLIENVGYQQSLSDSLKPHNVKTTLVSITSDKRSRLACTAYLIQTGGILFPKNGTADELINQIINFGVERYDDLADAFSLLLLKILEEDKGGFDFFFIDMPGGFYRGLSSEYNNDPLRLDKIF